MSRRHRPTNPASPFPFLAVLVSAMGALILLLLVIARQAQLQPAEVPEAKTHLAPLPPLPELQEYAALPPLPAFERPELEQHQLPALPELEDPRTSLLAKINVMKQQIANARQSRTGQPSLPEERLLAVEQALESLQSRVAELAKRRKWHAVKLEALNAELKRLEQEKRRAERTALGGKYAIVPYAGSHGTQRRPIFLECCSEGVILRPENVPVLTSQDKKDVPETESPLLVAIRALIEYHDETDSAGTPYPLFLVRPEGIGAYYFGQEALAGTQFRFGYELIEQEMEIEYPAADPKRREIVEAALRRVREERARMLARIRWPSQLPRVPGRFPLPANRQSGADGGSERENGASTIETETTENRRGSRGGVDGECPHALSSWRRC